MHRTWGNTSPGCHGDPSANIDTETDQFVMKHRLFFRSFSWNVLTPAALSAIQFFAEDRTGFSRLCCVRIAKSTIANKPSTRRPPPSITAPCECVDKFAEGFYANNFSPSDGPSLPGHGRNPLYPTVRSETIQNLLNISRSIRDSGHTAVYRCLQTNMSGAGGEDEGSRGARDTGIPG
ncbi:hypothetical protein PoB_006889100 [Plakobranchus ocellatus]|uniref:Uncharacterized protein n=1 Tax=Plakobranchus ocellatus TaxID=259542 RepID=A0AAV4DE06_9GAST|nr:hypothetical protein PoB_006889100 [Plakobranchus ocellatus]